MSRTERRRMIVNALRAGARSPRDVARVTGLDSHYVNNALIWLVAIGVAAKYGHGRYRLSWLAEIEQRA
jgi:hypothetical protein